MNAFVDFQLAFRGVRGTNFRGDIAIDDVNFKLGFVICNYFKLLLLSSYHVVQFIHWIFVMCYAMDQYR